LRSILKKIALIVIAVVVAVQIPFIYRRYQIGKLQERVNAASAERRPQSMPGYSEYKGIFHVHTFLGGHSTGTFAELISAANSNELDFVVMTEHYEDAYDTSTLTLNGVYGKTLFINGQEVDANDGGRYLLLPGTPEASQLAKLDSKALLDKIHSEGRIAINNYPERKRSETTDFDGMEAYSLHINAKSVSPFTAVFDTLWSFSSYPEMTYATYFRRNDDYLKRYDAIAATKPLLLAAGTDAHSNRGYYLAADDEGHRFFGVKIDPYETVFRLMRMHVMVESGKPISRENIIEAFRKGNAFVGFDVLGDTGGFTFSADNGSEKRIMGDTIGVGNGVHLSAAAPRAGRFILLKNGAEVARVDAASEFSTTVTEPGAYRIEAYLDDLGEPFDKAPWIMSNPIYVR
jgi:hypothetical protein